MMDEAQQTWPELERNVWGDMSEIPKPVDPEDELFIRTWLRQRADQEC